MWVLKCSSVKNQVIHFVFLILDFYVLVANYIIALVGVDTHFGAKKSIFGLLPPAGGCNMKGGKLCYPPAPYTCSVDINDALPEMEYDNEDVTGPYVISDLLATSRKRDPWWIPSREKSQNGPLSRGGSRSPTPDVLNDQPNFRLKHVSTFISYLQGQRG